MANESGERPSRSGDASREAQSRREARLTPDQRVAEERLLEERMRALAASYRETPGRRSCLDSRARSAT